MIFKNISILTHRLGQNKIGVAYGPKNLGYLIKLLTNNSINVKTLKLPNETIEEDMSMIYNSCHSFGSQKRVHLGGDHSLSIATISNMLNFKPNLKVIWVDAHADINTYQSSTTKNYHGMPLSYLTHLNRKTEFNFTKHKLDFKNILYIGLRDIDPFEESIIKKHNMKVLDIDTIRNNRKETITCIQEFMGTNPVYLSFDVDVLDPSIMECTGTPVNNGLFQKETKELMKPILQNKNLCGVEIVEFNPIDKEYENIKDNMHTIYDIFRPIFEKI